MGIRGAWSMLSKEPRRYGHPWVLANEGSAGARTVLFFDGPSLLYHLATTVYDCPPTKLETESNDVSNLVSPDLIYNRTTTFFCSLLASVEGSIDVNVVMDGLAPLHKIPTQTSRLRSVAILCEDLAVSRGKNKTRKQVVLHVFAEAAMVEALNKIREKHPSVCVHQPVHGEAESFIAQWLCRQHSDINEVVILSDDTDFLVYPSCPGFVPFRSLEFQVVSGRMRLTGFQYLRSKFLASFLSLGEGHDDELVMTTVAALSGCDYVLSPEMESILQRVRTSAIQSNIGGLRHRQRNDPSSSAALLAILRFVTHFCKTKKCTKDTTSDSSPWLVSLAGAVCGPGKGQEQRAQRCLAGLYQIFDIYFPSASFHTETDHTSPHLLLWTTFARLVECGVIFCYPLVETWGINPVQTDCRPPLKKTNRRHTKDQAHIAETIVLDGMQSTDNLPSEVISVSPSRSLLTKWIARGSIWRLPHFCQVRARLYSLLCVLASSETSIDRLRFHPTWSSSRPTVTEYLRVGTKRDVDFGERTVPVPRGTSLWNEKAVKDSFVSRYYRFVSFCILGRQLHPSDERILSTVPTHWALLFFSSLLLPKENAILLLLVGTATHEKLTPLTNQHDVPVSDEAAGAQNESAWLIAVACFHAALAMNGAGHLVDSDDNACLEKYGTISTHLMFRTKVTTCVWEVLDSNYGDDENGVLDSNYGDDDNGLLPETSEPLEDRVNDFFQRFWRIQRTAIKPNQSEHVLAVNKWKNDALDLWQKWCHFAKDHC